MTDGHVVISPVQLSQLVVECLYPLVLAYLRDLDAGHHYWEPISTAKQCQGASNYGEQCPKQEL